MRIAHVVSTFPPYHGGMGNVAKELAERAAARGHEVIVVTPGNMQNAECRMQNDDAGIHHSSFIIHHSASWLRFGNAAWCPSIRRALEEVQPDIVHLHWPFIGGIASVLRWWRRGGEQNHSPIRTNRRMVGGGQTQRKLVVHYHMDLIAGGWKGALFRLYEHWVLPWAIQFADRVVVSSRDYAAHGALAPFLARLGDRLIEIPFGVDVERFTPHPPTRLRQGFGGHAPPLPVGRGEITKDFSPSSRGGARGGGAQGEEREGAALRVLFVGGLDRAHAFKGVAVLLCAIARLTDGHRSERMATDHGLRLSVVGDGDLRSSYEAQTRALGIADRVTFLGAVSDADLPAVYRSANVLVLPSTARSEAFGVVLLEAMASGIPVIASDLPGVCTVVADSQTGFLAPPGDAAALAERLAVLIKNPEQVHTMGAVARRRVEEHYTWNRVMDAWEQCYQAV